MITFLVCTIPRVDCYSLGLYIYVCSVKTYPRLFFLVLHFSEITSYVASLGIITDCFNRLLNINAANINAVELLLDIMPKTSLLQLPIGHRLKTSKLLLIIPCLASEQAIPLFQAEPTGHFSQAP